MKTVTKDILLDLYTSKKLSVKVIADSFNCSENKITYWLNKYGIKKRSISEAIYIKRNPNGDPFKESKLTSKTEFILYGIGLGLYWGEGTKSNKLSIRLGNTNPNIIKTFLNFLHKIYNIDKNKLKFGLQVFNDMDPIGAKNFWKRELNLKNGQFQKIVITPSRGLGNYRNKTKYGVLTLYYHNKKLRDIICGELEKIV